MKFAHVLGWINTRIILSIVYFFIFTPLALIFRLMGKDPLGRPFEAVDSYWAKKEAKTFKPDDYRRQF